MIKNNKKANEALIMLCYTCALGAFGAFFRWLQLQTARDSETGLINPSVLNYLLPAVIIAAAVLLFLLTRKLTNEDTVFPTGMSEALRGLSLIYIICAWIFAAIAVIGGVLTIVNTELDTLRSMYVVIAVLAMLSGLGFPIICSASRSHYSPSLISILMTFPIIMYCVWLVSIYRANASNPNLWIYAIETIAVCVILIALFYVAGYAFGRPEPKKACFMSLFAAFMCITTLADSRYTGLELILVSTAGMLLMYGWLIVKNRCAPPEPEAEKKPEEAPAEPVEPEVKPEDTVIPATEDSSVPEPTLEAPTRKPKEKKNPDPSDDVEEIIKEYKKE